VKKTKILFLLILAACFSCIDKEQCQKDYLEADDWMIERTKMAGDNQEAKDAIYKEYLKKYAEIRAKCEN
jgi:hypothetical protein